MPGRICIREESSTEGVKRGIKSTLSLRMERSASSHKRRCYFTPQGLSSGVMSLPSVKPSQSEPIIPSTTSLPPPLCPEHRAKQQCSLLKRQRSVSGVWVVTNRRHFHQLQMMMTHADKCVITCRKVFKKNLVQTQHLHFVLWVFTHPHEGSSN